MQKNPDIINPSTLNLTPVKTHQVHWSGRVIVCVFISMLTFLAGLQLLKLFILNESMHLAFLTPFMGFSLTEISSALVHSGTHGLIMNGLLCLILIGISPQAKNQLYPIALLSLLWNLVLAWQIWNPEFLQSAKFIIPISNLFHLHPSPYSIEAFMIQIAYLIIWSTGFLYLLEQRSAGVFHFHRDVYSLLLAGYSSYGCFLVINTLSSELAMPFQEPSWLIKASWIKDFSMNATILFALIAALHLFICIKKANLPEGLSLSHGFALLIGYGLVYLANPMINQGNHVPESLQMYLWGGLALIWLSHVFYCFYAAQQLIKNYSLSGFSTLLLWTSLGLITIGITRHGFSLVPSTLSHQIPFWWIASEEFIVSGALLLSALLVDILTSEVRTAKPSRVMSQYSLLHQCRQLILFFGSIICLISGMLSLYLQQSFEASIQTEGMPPDFHELQGKLQPLLKAYTVGVSILLFGLVTQASGHIWLLLKSLFLNTPPQQTPAQNINDIENFNPVSESNGRNQINALSSSTAQQQSFAKAQKTHVE